MLFRMVSAQDRSAIMRTRTNLGFKEIAVLPGNRLDESDAVTLVMTTTTGLKLTFGLERLVAEELQQGLGRRCSKTDPEPQGSQD